MFSFRRKPKKDDASPQIHTSPSLPQLHSQGIPWPENLVDVASIQQAPPPDYPQQGAAKTSFQGPDRAPVSFHKPFRGSPGKPPDGASISSLYMSNVPSAFENRRFTTITTASRQSHRRSRIPPTFNLMVVGGLGTGKTSLLRLLLETADISPMATADQQTAVDRFLRGSTKHTQSIQTACVEICESRFDRLLFSIIDTPGLDFAEGHELKLERQVNGIIKYVDAQYADTMSEESKVIRQSKGDQHIHLCIYMIDPSSIMTSAARRASSSLPTKTRSEATISYQPPDLVPDNSSVDDSDDESSTAMTMSPAEIRVIHRLSARSNVLPVIARADSLTDEKLLMVKDAVRRSLREANLDFGVFGPMANLEETPRNQSFSADGHATNGNIGNGDMNGIEEHSDGEEEVDVERPSRPVIKLRSPRHGRPLSRSRSRRELSESVMKDSDDVESVAIVRFSAHIVAKTDLSGVMPFAVIAPEGGKRRKRPFSPDMPFPRTPVTAMSEEDHGGHGSAAIGAGGMQSPASTHSRLLPYLQAPPEDLKGVFTRNFRWGTIDVLNPDHCDFAALRTAILSTHFKLLKVHTKEVLYEKYRTQKLLARRATCNISEDERKRILEDLGI